MEFSSKYIQEAVEVFSKLPGIGKKSALRMVLHFIQKDENFAKEFSEKLYNMRVHIQYCKICNNISDETECSICKNHSRSNGKICIVENLRDVIAIENTGQFYGRYHVLGHLIVPIQGIGPDDINISSLKERIVNEDIEEIIFALSPTIEGDTTSYYISKILETLPIKLSTIARGVSFGGELEYADEVTLARSISHRLPFSNYVKEIE